MTTVLLEVMLLFILYLIYYYYSEVLWLLVFETSSWSVTVMGCVWCV